MPPPSTGFSLTSAFDSIASGRDDIINSRYRNPYADLASRDLPKSLRKFWGLTQNLTLTHPIVGPLVHKRATYVVTDPKYDGGDTDSREKYKELFESQLRIRTFQAGFNLDYLTFGDAYATPLKPMWKILRCRSCGKLHNARNANYVMEGGINFMLKCSYCSKRTRAEVHDVYFKDPKGIRLMRWNPHYIWVEENPYNGERRYWYKPPQIIQNAIKLNNRKVIASIPQEFLKATKEGHALLFSPDMIFAAHRPGPSIQMYRGHGLPLAFPVVKDAHLLQIMRAAQESILYEHLVPMRIASPADSGALMQLGGLPQFMDVLKKQVQGWRLNQNRMIVLPLPVNIVEAGGKGKWMLLNQEIRQQAEIICGGMGQPIEMLFGGLSYTGSSVSLRVVENDMMFDYSMNEDLLQYTGDFAADYMKWPRIKISQRKFKMADDLPRASFVAQLVERNKVSTATLLQQLDMDPERERIKIKEEVDQYGDIMTSQAIIQARSQSMGQKVMAQTQFELSRLEQSMTPQVPMNQIPRNGTEQPPGLMSPEESAASARSPLQPGQSGFDMNQYASYIYNQISGAPRDQQLEVLHRLRAAAPGAADLVQRLVMSGGPSEDYMKPLPEQRPPRRGPMANTVV